jgi:hypothetical protein
MKIFYNLIITLLILCFSLIAAEDPALKNSARDWSLNFLSHADIDIKGSSVFIISQEGGKATIEMTKNGQLYIDGRKVRTNNEEKQLIKEYHHLIVDIVESAEEVGIECAEIGIESAEIGINAVQEVIQNLCDEQEWKYVERKLEKKAKKIEATATKLENKIEDLEELAEEMGELHQDMLEHFPELKEHYGH